MKHLIHLFFITLLSQTLIAQVAPDKYFIEFNNKTGTPYSLSNPNDYLSERAIERRQRYSIAIDSCDLPVNPDYIQAVANAGVEILNVSKWLNGVTVYASSTSAIQSIANLPFVKSVNLATKKKKKNRQSIDDSSMAQKSGYQQAKNNQDVLNYGLATPQTYLHNGQILHNNGFRGQNMIIAVTDAGFTGVDNQSVFDSLFINNRIISTRNYINSNEDIYRYSTHGTNVLSIIGGNLPGTMVGTAPEARYILLVTEDAASEHIIEEINWSCGAEFADSAGADLINVSLGYFEYDFPYWSHQVAQLDGNTAWVSKAAGIASNRGMIVVVSAGNSGNEEMPYVSTPGDNEFVLTVGAVSYDSIIAGFSSIGPTADGRIKPDVCAIGAGTYCSQWGEILPGNGTSFAAPILSGLIACLWQAFPNMTSVELIQAIKNSGNYASLPTNQYGFGIPDLGNLYLQLNTINQQQGTATPTIRVFPNPFGDTLNIQYSNMNTDLFEVVVIASDGSTILKESHRTSGEQSGIITLSNTKSLLPGSYVISVAADKHVINQKIIKEP